MVVILDEAERTIPLMETDVPTVILGILLPFSIVIASSVAPTCTVGSLDTTKL